MAELLSDIKHSYIMLQAEVLYSVCHVSTADKCARRAADGDLSCLFKSAVLQQSRSLFEEVYQIFLGDNLVNKKDTDSRPDCAEWCLAKWAELDALIGMGCWHYWPKSDKHNDPVRTSREKEKALPRKICFQAEAFGQWYAPMQKDVVRHSDPKFLQKSTDIDCFSLMCGFSEMAAWCDGGV